jgi:U3 small nucleolar RNA-associated protein 14
LQPNVKNAKGKYVHKNVCGTSTWDIKEIEHNEETEDQPSRKKSKERNQKKSKISKSIDEMFDLLEENLEHKKDVKLKEIKKKLDRKIEREQKRMDEQREKKKKKRKEENKGDEEIRDLEFKNFNSKPILDQPLDETSMTENVQKKEDLTNFKLTADMERELINKANNRETEIDPDKYLNIKPKYLKTQLPDVTNEGEDVLDNSEQEEETHRIMSEAFADDDVVEEFRKAKEEEVCWNLKL